MQVIQYHTIKGSNMKPNSVKRTERNRSMIDNNTGPHPLSILIFRWELFIWLSFYIPLPPNTIVTIQRSIINE